MSHAFCPDDRNTDPQLHPAASAAGGVHIWKVGAQKNDEAGGGITSSTALEKEPWRREGFSLMMGSSSWPIASAAPPAPLSPVNEGAGGPGVAVRVCDAWRGLLHGEQHTAACAPPHADWTSHYSSLSPQPFECSRMTASTHAHPEQCGGLDCAVIGCIRSSTICCDGLCGAVEAMQALITKTAS
jgi:hypothetical protein